MDDTYINNDLSNYENEAEQEEIAKEFMSYEEAPAPEFINVEQVTSAIVDALISHRRSITLSNNGKLYVGQRFTTKEALQNAVKSYSIRVHQQFEVIYSIPTLWVLKCKQAP